MQQSRKSSKSGGRSRREGSGRRRGRSVGLGPEAVHRHVARGAGNAHCQAVQVLAGLDLAAQPRPAGEMHTWRTGSAAVEAASRTDRACGFKQLGSELQRKVCGRLSASCRHKGQSFLKRCRSLSCALRSPAGLPGHMSRPCQPTAALSPPQLHYCRTSCCTHSCLAVPA